MAKWYGAIGFSETGETKPGVWQDTITVRNYYGDVIRNSRRLQSGDRLNDNLNVSNQISIVSDPYANQNFHAIRYIEFMGANWKVTDVEVQYPRLILTIGGVYNGELGPESSGSEETEPSHETSSDTGDDEQDGDQSVLPTS